MKKPSAVVSGQPQQYLDSLNLTQRKLADADKEGLLEAFIESLPGVFYLFDADGPYLRWNRELERVSGWTAEELASRRPLELVAEEDRALVASRIEEVFRAGVAQTEGRLLTRDGAKIPFLFTGRRVQIGGRPCVAGVGIDLSGEKGLKQEQESFFRLSSDLFCILESSGRIHQVNEAWRNALGWSQEELLGRDARELIHPEDRSTSERVLRPHPDQPPVRVWIRVRHKDATYRWISWSSIMAAPDDRIFAVGRDVTESHAAQVALSESEERYRALFEINPLPMLLVDLEAAEVLEANQAAEEHYGRPRAEFVRLSLAELWAEDLPAAGLPGPAASPWAAWSRGWRHRKKSGEVFDAEVVCRQLGSGKASSVVMLVQDVTLRRQAAELDAALSRLGRLLSEATRQEEAAASIAEVLREFLGWDAFFMSLYSEKNDSHFPILALDTIRGEVVDCSGELRGGSRPGTIFKDILASGPRLILRDDESPPPEQLYGDTARRSESLMFVPIRKGNQPIGILSLQSYRPHAYSSRDLKVLETLSSQCGGALERLRAEAALREAQQTFSRAFEASPISMSISRFGDGRMSAVNDAFLQLFGFEREEAIGRSGLELGIWKDARVREQLFDELHRGEQVRDRLIQFRTKQGEGRDVLLSVANLRVGSDRCLLFYAYDVTQRVELEQQLREAQKLESVGQLAAGVAHDFNNLLTVIDGCTSLAQREGASNPTLGGLLDQISGAAKRAGNLTRQLLAFSRRQRMQLRALDLKTLIRDLEAMLRQLLGEKRRLEIEIGGGEARVMADQGMLEQVIVNLALNARDAMPDDGTLRITVAQVNQPPGAAGSSGRDQGGPCIVLRFADTGCGIGAEEQGRVFEPFFTTKEVGQGSGLGLSTAYGIVKQHKGWIDLDSTLGQGSTFSIFLPAHASAPPPEPARVEENANTDLHGCECVLLVEDEAPVRALVERILGLFGYRVIAADGGEGALALWRERSAEIDALVTDMVMPGMGGRQLAERILAERPDLPVLYMSGYSRNQEGSDLRLVEGRNFLPKPFGATQLVRALRVCLDRRGSVG